MAPVETWVSQMWFGNRNDQIAYITTLGRAIFEPAQASLSPAKYMCCTVFKLPFSPLETHQHISSLGTFLATQPGEWPTKLAISGSEIGMSIHTTSSTRATDCNQQFHGQRKNPQ